jgi:hypothetical protein
MRTAFFIFFTALFLNSLAQIEYSARILDLGNIEEAYEIKADILLSNRTDRKHYLLKADADPDLTVFASKKTIPPGDTALLVLTFTPRENGYFSKKIRLFTSNGTTADELILKGNLKHLKSNDKQACYYFGKPKPIKPERDVVKIESSGGKNPKPFDNHTGINSTEMPPPTFTAPIQEDPKPFADTLKNENIILPVSVYKPNHLLFLIDVSNSMKDSLKLPLMKLAIRQLINDLRAIDRVTFITYSDSIRVLAENIGGSEKKLLHSLNNSLKAKGLTKGRQAILKSEDVLLKHYVADGNNQIILATDGKFNFYPDDRKNFESKQNGKPIVLSTLAFGNDKEAMHNLKEIAKAGNGSFIHIKKQQHAYELLLNEIKERSKK